MCQWTKKQAAEVLGAVKKRVSERDVLFSLMVKYFLPEEGRWGFREGRCNEAMVHALKSLCVAGFVCVRTHDSFVHSSIHGYLRCAKLRPCKYIQLIGLLDQAHHSLPPAAERSCSRSCTARQSSH